MQHKHSKKGSVETVVLQGLHPSSMSNQLIHTFPVGGIFPPKAPVIYLSRDLVLSLMWRQLESSTPRWEDMDFSKHRQIVSAESSRCFSSFESTRGLLHWSH